MFHVTTQINKRAKRIKIQFCHYRGLMIISPKKLDQKHIQALCTKHQDWIQQQYQNNPVKQIEKHPTHLHLTALSCSVTLHFSHATHNKLQHKNNALYIQGASPDQRLSLLKRWIRQQAQIHYPKKIKEWSKKTGLSYNRLNIRSQKSRWGSCSSKGTISLNDQLLFMPDSILDYIIVHELCHTVQANHSQHFWQLVATHYPNYQQQETLLANSVHLIPPWFRASLYR